MTKLDDLSEVTACRDPSRRDLIVAAAGLGAASLTLAGAGTACAADVAVKGGNLKIGMGGGFTTDSIEPGAIVDSVAIAVGHALFNGLVEWGNDGKAVPELAESWEARAGARTWVFNLRKGIRFSNGKIFDAEDAVYSLNLHRGTTKSGAAGPMKAITDIKILDSHQIEITLREADADFPYVLTDYHVLMVPRDFADWSRPVGTGAFTLEKFDPGVRILLKKGQDYWKIGRGHVDSVEITVINDSPARHSALISKQVHAINRLDPKLAPVIARNSELEIVRAAGGWHPVMAMQTDVAPYDNPDVRRALKYAMDRKQISSVLFSDYGTVGNDHPIPRSDPYFNTELAQIPHDPDKAAFYFRQAGFGDAKLRLQASDAAFNGAVDMGTVLQANCRKAGIQVEEKKEAAEGFWSDVWLKGAFVAAYWGGRPAATQMLGIAYGAGAPWNETHWNNARFESLLAEAKAETDEAKRKPMIWEMQSLLSTEGGALIPAFRDWIEAASKKVGGLAPTSGFDMCNGYVCEQAWLKA